MATLQIPIVNEYFKPEIPIYGRFLYEIRNDTKIRAVIPLWIVNAKQIIAVKQLYMIHHLVKHAQRITAYFMRYHLFHLDPSVSIFTVWRVSFCLFFCSCSWPKLSFPGKSLWRGLCSFLTLEKLRRCSLFFSTTCFLSPAKRRDSQRRSALIILHVFLSFTALLSWFWPVQPFCCCNISNIFNPVDEDAGYVPGKTKPWLSPQYFID